MAWIKDCPKSPGIYAWRSGTHQKARIMEIFWHRPSADEAAELSARLYGFNGAFGFDDYGQWWDEPLEFPWEEENEP